jgi:hypothetical protein
LLASGVEDVALDPNILTRVLESHDRLVGVVDGDGALVQLNARARGLLAAEQKGATAFAPAPLADAAADAREGGVQRRGLLVPTDRGERFLSGHLWPMGAEYVGFALRADGATSPDVVALRLGVQPWQARHALHAAQGLSDQDIAIALTNGSGSLEDRLHDLARSVCEQQPLATGGGVTYRVAPSPGASGSFPALEPVGTRAGVAEVAPIEQLQITAPEARPRRRKRRSTPGARLRELIAGLRKKRTPEARV